MLGDLITRILVLLLGYACPAYECFKSLEKNNVDNNELRGWCQYWIIIGLLTVCERVGDIFMSWLPMYDGTKLAFIIYLRYQKTDEGASHFYKTLLRPFLAEHQTDIDRKLLEYRARAWNFARDCCQNCIQLAQATFFQVHKDLEPQSAKLETSGSEGCSGSLPIITDTETKQTQPNILPEKEKKKKEK